MGLRFHFTGGLVSSLYGEPRFTQDIDIVLRLAPGSPDLEPLLDRLSADFTLDKDVARDAVRRGSIFQALDSDTLLKIDFHVGEAIAGELDRSRVNELLPGLAVPIVTKEDAILSKLLWIRKGSHKSRQDVIAMLSRPEPIDNLYLEEQAGRLSVVDLLTELRAVSVQG